MIGNSPVMIRLRQFIDRAAPTNNTVLILGEKRRTIRGLSSLKAVDIVNEQPQLFPASFLDEIRKDAQLLEQEQQEHTGLASARAQSYPSIMIIIRFPDAETERRALGYLAGRFSFKSWATGETMVPERALSFLAAEGIRFSVEGPATYERLAPLRDLSSAKI